MKTFRIIIFSILLLFLLFILSGAFITRYYSKDVTRYILSEISKNIEIELNVGQVENLSIFNKFPFASITLMEVMVKETLKTKGEKDTLLYLKKAFLQFNIIDIFLGDYKIKRISISDGFVRLKVNEKGRENYLFNTTPKKDGGGFLLKLSRMNISNVEIFYNNELKEQAFDILCSEAIVKGNFSNEKFRMALEGDFFSRRLKNEDVEFFSQRNISLKTDFEINKDLGIYTLKNGELSIDRSIQFEISGSFSESKNDSSNSGGKGKENYYLTDIKIKGKNLDIPSLIEMLPPDKIKALSNYRSKGHVSFNCSVSGEFSKEKTPSVTAEFIVENGSVIQKNTAYSLNSIFLKGNFSNGKTKNSSSTLIDVRECKGVLGIAGNDHPGGNIKAEFKIKNLNNPHLNLTAQAGFDLDILEQFINIDTLEKISGKVDINLSYEGLLKPGEEYSARDFRQSKSSGNINFQNVHFILKKSPLSYDDFSGNLTIINNDALIKNMKGSVSSSDFELNGFFRNAVAWLFLPDEKLTVEAAIHSNNLNLNELLSEGNSPGDTSYLLAFSNRVNFNLNAEIEHLVFRKFTASGFSGIVTISDKDLRSNDISFKTMDGKVKGSLEIEASESNSIVISSNASIENVDINKLFNDFENFGQNVITANHLKGMATADIRFIMMMDSSLNVDENKIYALADLTIEKGELIGFEPMDDISGFIKNHVFLKRIIKADEFERKLKHIRFSALKNQILISDRKITVPAMTINSSAMNIEAEGIHTFDNILDYKINFFLSELLTKKGDLSQDEFGEIEEDDYGKKKVYLTIKGAMDNPEITYDKKKMKKKLKEEKEKEKMLVKGILKEEFGWFKKDSLAKESGKNHTEDFIIEWEDNNSTDDSIPSSKTGIKKNEKKIDKLLEKLGGEEEKKEEDFEIEKGEDF